MQALTLFYRTGNFDAQKLKCVSVKCVSCYLKTEDFMRKFMSFIFNI